MPRSRPSSAALLACTLLGAVLAPTHDALAAARGPNERPLPAFGGVSLDGRRVDVSDYIGKRLVLFFFNPEVPASQPVARAVAAIAKERGKYNFEVLGVAIGSNRAKARQFRDATGLGDVVVIDDSSASITQRLGLQSPVMVIGADAEGYLSFGMTYFDTEAKDPAKAVENQMRQSLRIPVPGDAAAGTFGVRPQAPLFEATRLDGGEPFRLASLAGRPAVLIFFLHTCPHCHAALAYLKKQIATMPADARPVVIGVSVLDRPAAIRAMIAEHGFAIDEVLLDPDREVQEAYGLAGGVPDIYFLDGDRRIVHRIQGWQEKRDPALARMVLAKIAGARIPMLLNPKGYTGDDVCGVCHDLELETWQYTQHASAYATLVTHGEERNDDCVGCHVVGFDEPGGFTIADAPPHLENVSCESCHGRGGPHLSKGFVEGGNYEPVCTTCHDSTHSLGFDYATFRPAISHARIASLSADERAALGHARPKSVLPERGDYVGSDACRTCHPKEFETWSRSGHAHALDSLAARGKTGSDDCLKCHTTGWAKPGGFRPGEAAGGQSDLARVGCESCHGPGGEHVKPDVAKIGSIVSLGDKCDSCVILQICGGCHDDANDPGFEFEVVEKIERQRHGTIEAGTGRALDASAGAEGAGARLSHARPGDGSTGLAGAR